MGLMIRDLIPREIQDLTAYRAPEGEFEIRLDANESPFPLPGDVQARIESAFSGVMSNRYPDPSSRRLREAFAGVFGCAPNAVLAGNGSDELIALLLATFRNTRDRSRPRILIPVPTFTMYSISARAAGFDVLGIPLRSNLTLDREAFLSEITTTDPGIIFLSSPNNPTGTLFGREDIEAILKASRGLVVVDEAYGDFSGEASWISRISEHGNLAVLRTLSKVGAASFRCGFMVAQPSLVEEINKVRLPFNINAFTQAAAGVLLEDYAGIREQILTVVEERTRMAGILEGCGLEVFPSRANFLFVRAGGREEALWTFLKQSGIVVKFIDGSGPVGDALRVTIGTRAQNDTLAAKISSFFGKETRDEAR